MGEAQETEEVAIKGVMPTQSGCAVFLAASEKTFVIYVDHGIGQSISMAFNEVKKERPLTHDLMMSILTGLEAHLEHVTINDVDDGTFFARIVITMENELGRKIVEIDARPSDSMVLALQAGKPIFVARRVLDAVEDMTDILKRILKQREEDDDEDVPF